VRFLNQPLDVALSTTFATMTISNDIAKTMDDVVAPISSDYCTYFYVISLLAAAMFVITTVSLFVYGIRKKKSAMFFLGAIGYTIAYVLVYLQNRLLYNMCVRSL
jgi:hypothetical protein